MRICVKFTYNVHTHIHFLKFYIGSSGILLTYHSPILIFHIYFFFASIKNGYIYFLCMSTPGLFFTPRVCYVYYSVGVLTRPIGWMDLSCIKTREFLPFSNAWRFFFMTESIFCVFCCSPTKPRLCEFVWLYIFLICIFFFRFWTHLKESIYVFMSICQYKFMFIFFSSTSGRSVQFSEIRVLKIRSNVCCVFCLSVKYEITS